MTEQEEIIALAEAMHTSLCRWNHTDGCSWWYENERADKWEKGWAHSKYLKGAEAMANRLQASSQLSVKQIIAVIEDLKKAPAL